MSRWRNNGGWNRSHDTVERTPRVDSFDLALTEVWGRLWWKGTEIPTYREWDSCTLFPGCKGEQEIMLDHKPNGYGSSQIFFLCPTCGVRVRFLYFNGKGQLFKCRRCSHLNYKSQQRTKGSDDGYDMGMKLAREKLRVTDRPCGFDFMEYIPPRPWYMHMDTYRRYLKRFLKHRERFTEHWHTDLLRIVGKWGNPF